MAKRGRADAIELLRGPRVPEHVEYVRDWAFQVHGRSGAGGMGGLAPLSYPALWAWADLYGHELDPCDIHALTVLDGVLLHPEQAIDDEPEL